MIRVRGQSGVWIQHAVHDPLLCEFSGRECKAPPASSNREGSKLTTLLEDSGLGSPFVSDNFSGADIGRVR